MTAPLASEPESDTKPELAELASLSDLPGSLSLGLDNET